MKKILFICGLIFSVYANAQLIGWVPYASKNKHIGMAADSLMYMPVKDTTHTPQRLGAYTMRPQDSCVYIGISQTAGTQRWAKLAKYSELTTVGNAKWALGGNTLSSAQTFGTVSNHDLPFITNNTERARILSTGNFGIGTSSPGSLFTVGANAFTVNSSGVVGAGTWNGSIINQAYLGTGGGGSTKFLREDNTWQTLGGGTVNSGTDKRVAYYAGTGTTVDDATGVEVGNTNERLTVTAQATTETALLVKQAGGGNYPAITIEASDASNPYTPMLRFKTTGAGSPGIGLMAADYGRLNISGANAPYESATYEEMTFGTFYAGVKNVRIHTYAYGTPASPNDWTMILRTPTTSSSGLAINWGATGQTADLLQMRMHDNTELTKFNKDGKISKYNTSAVLNGELLIGHTSNGTFEKATLTAGQNISITNGAGAVTIATDITLAQGTYTPTLTNTTNITSSTAYTTHYFRVGDQITVWGQVEITPTAVGACELRMTLPVATSNFNNTYEAAGNASEGTQEPTKISNARILAVTADGKVKLLYNDQIGGSRTFSFSFTYKYVTP